MARYEHPYSSSPAPDDENDDYVPWGDPGRLLGRPPMLLARALTYLYDGYAGQPAQLGTTRIAEGIGANPVTLRRELAKRPDLIASWRYRKARVWRLTTDGETCARLLRAGADPRRIPPPP